MSQPILYVYPEEWTGRRAREVQTLQTCLALADLGLDVTLVTGDAQAVRRHATEFGRRELPGRLHLATVSRRLGPVRSVRLFASRFRTWLGGRAVSGLGYAIHLKAARVLGAFGIPYLYEAHEVFAESARSPRHGRRLERAERLALEHAVLRVATSQALAAALNRRYFPDRPLPFVVIPNAGDPPLAQPLLDPAGPLVYAGSLADWKGLPLALEAAARLGVPVRVVGGDRAQWERLAAALSPGARRGATWLPRRPVAELDRVLAGCRAGLIPTRPDSGSGRYSCPLKLFDYARCGLPVAVTDLPSLDALDPGPWCVRVGAPTVDAWVEGLRRLPADGWEVLRWAASHTWYERAVQLRAALTALPRGAPHRAGRSL
ncbi:MAG TPA: glycosyltransferase [Calidithermus sp.]|nr:glycosyltransferase [Calidithermus sp.]